MFGSGKGQIATEFIMLYAIILLVFVLIFAIITGQRAVILNTQQYSLLNLQAQQISSYINYALSAGNGFSMSLPLGAGFSPLTYTLTMSNMGVVMLETSEGGQPVTAYAFSSGRNMVINGVLSQSNNGVSTYNVPTYSGMLNISNSGGIIYIDSNPVTSAGLAGSLIPNKVKEGYVANFNPGSTVSVADTPLLRLQQANGYTIEMWIHQPSTVTPPIEILGKGRNGNSGIDIGFGLAGLGNSCATNYITFVMLGVPAPNFVCTSYPSDGSWHQFTVTFNSVGIYSYLDGQPGASATGSVGSVVSSTAPLTFGVGQSNDYFTGQLANIQMYNTSLTPNQISASYASGLFSTPVTSQNVIGWWPLNDNPNDYSGNGQMGLPTNVVYSSAGELDLSVIAHSGFPISADPVGIVITNGTAMGFTNSKLLSSQTGTVNAIVVYNSTGQNATAYAFNGNLSTASSLVDWWPLTLGEKASNANIIYDLGPNNANGVLSNILWSYKQDESSFVGALFPNNPTNINSNPLLGVVTINAIGPVIAITKTQNLTMVSWVKFLAGRRTTAREYSATRHSRHWHSAYGLYQWRCLRFSVRLWRIS